MFSCVWLHFKKCFGKYFLMFGCILENTIENTFSTCLLIFSHIFSVTKRIYNIIHSSKHKQNPEKNHQIRTNIARSAHCSDAFAVPVMSSFAFVISSFFLPLSCSLSLSSIFQGRKSFEVKMETEMIFRCFGSEIRSTGNAFQFDQI